MDLLGLLGMSNALLKQWNDNPTICLDPLLRFFFDEYVPGLMQHSELHMDNTWSLMLQTALWKVTPKEQVEIISVLVQPKLFLFDRVEAAVHCFLHSKLCMGQFRIHVIHVMRPYCTSPQLELLLRK